VKLPILSFVLFYTPARQSSQEMTPAMYLEEKMIFEKTKTHLANMLTQDGNSKRNTK